MRELELYGTSACHLCEQAESLLAEMLVIETTWRIELIDIADDDDMLESYAIKIPVLKDAANGRELLWPFNAADVKNFVGNGD